MSPVFLGEDRTPWARLNLPGSAPCPEGCSEPRVNLSRTGTYWCAECGGVPAHKSDFEDPSLTQWRIEVVFAEVKGGKVAFSEWTPWRTTTDVVEFENAMSDLREWRRAYFTLIEADVAVAFWPHGLVYEFRAQSRHLSPGEWVEAGTSED